MGKDKPVYIVKLVISVLACEAAGLIGGLFTASAIPTWYAALSKPSFTPPNWLFAPAWITLYLLMGVAASLVWEKGLKTPGVRPSLYVFLVQLVLNALWSVVFFGMKSPLGGFIVIAVLWLAILWTMLRFFRVSALAGWLLVPYILWVAFAAALNGAVMVLN